MSRDVTEVMKWAMVELIRESGYLSLENISLRQKQKPTLKLEGCEARVCLINRNQKKGKQIVWSGFQLSVVKPKPK